MKRLFKKFRETWAGKLTAIVLIWLLSVLIRLWHFSFRITVVDPDNFLAGPHTSGVIGGFWHNRLVFISAFFPRRLRRRTVAITSPSRDGEYADLLVRQFIAGTVRGSSSRGGGKAVIALKHYLDSGYNVCVAIDGPRGPKYEAAPGIVLLAKRCKAPIIPILINAPKRWQLKTWDGLQFPRPFSKVELVIGQPLEIDAECDLRTEGCQRVREALLAITDDTVDGHR